MHFPAVVAGAVGACLGYCLCSGPLVRVVRDAAQHPGRTRLPPALQAALVHMTFIALFCEVGCAGAGVALLTGRAATGFMTAMVAATARMVFLVTDRLHFRPTTAALCGALGAVVACQ